ncbi:hypothetical protein ACG83_38380 [Frankia sp. R43]|nr:hypothetical protein ACG83_38380 [Frankia sp. R43]
MRVLGRFVLALGDRGEHHPGRLTEIEQPGADQVPHVLDEHHGAPVRVDGAAVRVETAGWRV